MRFILFISLLIASMFLFAVHVYANDDFAEKYRTYKDHVQSASSAFQKKDYASAIASYSKAIAYFKSGKEKEAEEDFDKVIIMDPKMSSAYVYRGLCREKLSRYNDALNDYTRALKLKPNDAAIHNNIAYLYVSANDESFRDKVKALEHAKKAAELSKEKNAEVLDTLARAYFINGQIKEAIDAENKALKLEPYNDEFKGRLKEYEKAMGI
jgi:tetratricopeptide (TPR) repeat protein